MMKKTKTNRPALIASIMMISDRHKTNNLVTLFCCLCCCLLVGQANGNGTTTSTAATATSSTVITTKTNANQDEVNGLALTPDVTTAPRLDPNNNNEWRPLGHGDPLQKDPTYDYSPPALERVRYWAENNGSGQSNPEARKKELPPEVLRNKTKSEILLLGVASERERATRTGQHQHQHQHQQQQQQQNQQQHQQHYQQRHGSYSNPIQQSKYPPIRRSYYAPQQQQHQQQMQLQHQQQQQQQQQQYMPHTHLMPPPPMAMMMKGMEYRTGSASPSPYHISMSHMSSSSKQPMSSTSTATHHYYSSPSTSNWMTPHRMTYSPDAYHQESMQHFSYSRPQTNSVSYSPNSLQTHHSKPVSSAHRKPWLHELLQKELVKPKVKPTMPATKYLMGTTKPFTMAYTPVSFVPGPPTIAGPTVVSPSENQVSSEFRPMMLSTMITATPTTTTTTTTTSTTPMPIYQRPTTVPNSMATASNTGYTGTRLLIPQTSNLAQRPTVATAFDSDAVSQTTDSLFSHYKQPQKALLGPAYLIIEGHSKVKTYGQNELDPHSPKIVPVISKREPVVRRADPNEPKRGTVETFEVKHLHTKTTPMAMMTTTTTTKKPTTTAKPSPKTTTATTTTAKPSKTTVKPSISSTTRSTPRTTSAASTTTPSPATLTTTTAATTTVGGVHDLLSLLDNMFADAHEIVSPNSFPASGSPSTLQSLSSTMVPINYVTSTMSTILKPVSSSTKLLPQQPEPRIKSQAANSIFSLDDEDDQDDDDDDDNDKRSKIITSTEQPLRATRQVFDYDQLPESRIKDKKDGLTAAVDYMDELEEAEEMGEADLDTDSLLEDGQDDEADEEADNDENEDGEQAEDSEHNLLKRIDQFVDDVDDGDDDLDDLIENLDDEQDEDEDEEAEETLERRHHQH